LESGKWSQNAEKGDPGLESGSPLQVDSKFNLI